MTLKKVVTKITQHQRLLRSILMSTLVALTLIASAQAQTFKSVPAQLGPGEVGVLVVIEPDGKTIDMMRVKQGRWGLEATDFIVVDGGPSEYKCDHDPPQAGDNCECGSTGNELNDFFDCMSLLPNCAEGTLQEDGGCTHGPTGD